MIRNYFKITMKILGKNKFFSFLSIFGISMTIMFIMIVTTMLQNEIGPVEPEINRNKSLYIYRIKFKEGENTTTGGISLHFINKYLRDISIPHIESAQMSYPCEFIKNGKVHEKSIKYTDLGFWKIFQFDFIEGKPFNQMQFDNKENVMVINQSLKKILVGNTDATGKIIDFLGKKYKIVGVVKDIGVSCSDALSDAWMPYTNSPRYDVKSENYSGPYRFIIMPNSSKQITTIKEEVKERMRKLNQSLEEDKKVFLGGPDTNIEAFSRGYGDDPENSKISSTRFIFGWIGKFLLFMLLPALNLVSINITRIRERSEEIAIRKSFGASKRKLINQFITENLIITIMGGIIGIVLSFGAMHLFKYNIFSFYWTKDIPLEIKYHFNVFLYTIAACLVFGIFSGLIPAIKMSKLHPAYILKGGIK